MRTIGLSNWTRKQLKETLASCRVPPQVLQVELHPLLPQTELRADCAAAGIRVVTPTPSPHPDPSPKPDPKPNPKTKPKPNTNANSNPDPKPNP